MRKHACSLIGIDHLAHTTAPSHPPLTARRIRAGVGAVPLRRPSPHPPTTLTSRNQADLQAGLPRRQHRLAPDEASELVMAAPRRPLRRRSPATVARSGGRARLEQAQAHLAMARDGRRVQRRHLERVLARGDVRPSAQQQVDGAEVASMRGDLKRRALANGKSLGEWRRPPHEAEH